MDYNIYKKYIYEIYLWSWNWDVMDWDDWDGAVSGSDYNHGH